MKKIFQIILILCFAGPVFSQTQEIGIFGGGSYYLGDLNPSLHFNMIKPAYGAFIRYNYNSRWAFKVNAYRGKVAGADAVSKTNTTRGLSFSSFITDISANAEFNFFDYYAGMRKNIITPYIFAGFGVFFFKPTADGVNLRDMGTEGQNVGFEGRKKYNLFSFSIPFGFGVKYSLSNRFGLAFEWGLRKTFTDYIDDVSTTYYLDGANIDPANTANYLSDPTGLHKPYMERGNPKTRDWYAFTGLSLTYRFNMFGNRRCPDQRRF
jgi:hypothetical protein